MKKEVLFFDEVNETTYIAFGYTSKKEAQKAIEKHSGDIMDGDDLERKRVVKYFDKNDQPAYIWGGKKGILSWVATYR